MCVYASLTLCTHVACIANMSVPQNVNIEVASTARPSPVSSFGGNGWLDKDTVKGGQREEGHRACTRL